MYGLDALLPVALAADRVAPSQPSVSVNENVLKYVVYPLLALVAGILYKNLAEIRAEHLSQVRLVKAMINEIDIAHASWQNNKTNFTDAYAGGDPNGDFARKIASDEKYFPYSVVTKSTTSVFSAEEMPAKSFAFLRSETMERLVDFHDKSLLLDSSIADMREDVFRELKPERKLAVIGTIVGLFDAAETAYRPCREALLAQEARLTTASLTWMILFPFRSGSYPITLIGVWIVLNMLWHAFVKA